MNSYIRINSDHWNDSGKIWYVLSYKSRENSTAIELTLKDSFGIVESRVVPINQIEWVDE